MLYPSHPCDIPQTEHVTSTTYVDDTTILAMGQGNEETAYKLQQACNNVSEWTKTITNKNK